MGKGVSMSMPEPVRFRADIVVSPQQDSFVLKDPTSGRFYRFGEVEYFIIQQLDGSTSLDTVRQRAEERFGGTLPEDTAKTFLNRLQHLGLLETAGAARSTFRAPRAVSGSLLYLRFRAFDPDRLLDRLVWYARFCFTPQFLAISAALILCAAGITFLEWNAITRDFVRLYSFQGLFVAWLTILAVIVAHEFAHGLACKHFGGQVHEMGFMLLYFQPAFYCNVSDAWLFPEKSKRLWVTFAGAYFEMFLWALATMVWRVTAADTVLSYAALVVMATSAIKTLFNLNPLIKLDGYYLLSDYLEIPNLRQRAFSFLRAVLKKPWGAGKEATPREKRIYLTYGLLAGAYSTWLLAAVGLYVARLLVERYRGVGFLAFLVLLAVVFGPSLSKSARHGAVHALERKARRWLWRVAKPLLILLPALAVLYFGKTQLTVSGDFTVRPAHNVDVRAEVAGIIEKIYVDEGDVLKDGNPVARLSTREYGADLRKIQAEIEERQAGLNMLRAGPRAEEIALATTAVEKAQEKLKYSERERARMQTLFEQGLGSQRDVDQAEEELAVRHKESEEAQRRLVLLEAGSRPEEIQATEAELSRLAAQRQHVEEQLSLVVVKSPVAGTVVTSKLKEKVGQQVNQGDLIATIHDLDTVMAEISVPEKDIGDVKVGQEVVVKVRAYPDETFYATVRSIAPVTTSDETRRTNTVLVTTQLANPSLLLKPGMTGSAKIHCGERSLLALLQRKAAQAIRVEFWSWW